VVRQNSSRFLRPVDWSASAILGVGMQFASGERMQVWIARCALLCGYFCYAAPALACPNCPVGRAARQQVCEDAFWLRLSAVLLPFIVMSAISIWVERTTDRERGRL
jgi:hypothetical protein